MLQERATLEKTMDRDSRQRGTTLEVERGEVCVFMITDNLIGVVVEMFGDFDKS